MKPNGILSQVHNSQRYEAVFGSDLDGEYEMRNLEHFFSKPACLMALDCREILNIFDDESERTRHILFFSVPSIKSNHDGVKMLGN